QVQLELTSSRIDNFHRICATVGSAEQPQEESAILPVKRKRQFTVRFDGRPSKRNCQHDKHNDKHEKLQTLSQYISPQYRPSNSVLITGLIRRQLQPEARQPDKALNVPIQNQTPAIPPSANFSIAQRDTPGDEFFRSSQPFDPPPDNQGFGDDEIMRNLVNCSGFDWNLLDPLLDSHVIDSDTVGGNPAIQALGSSAEMPGVQSVDSGIMTQTSIFS
ncbi:hypothetical protein ACJ73_09880, partial [Blastomyces percursus]